MTLKETMKELESYGDEVIKNIYLNHGTKEPLFGVRVSDLKKIVKKIKKDHTLSLQLYETGNYDAMYLAGLIADENKISKNDLQSWIKNATNYGTSEYTVSWVAAESNYGYELGLEWIESDDEMIATAGWSTLANYASLTPDEDIDIEKFRQLLVRIEKSIHDSPNRVRYTMNGFVIAVGSYIIDLDKEALSAAKNIGKVYVNAGKTACKVPFAIDKINKVKEKGKQGKKRKMARC